MLDLKTFGDKVVNDSIHGWLSLDVLSDLPFCKYFWKLLSYFKIIDFEQWPCCVWNVKQLWRYCWFYAYLMIANSLYLQSKVESNTSQMMWGVRKLLELFLWQKYFKILQVAKFFKLFQFLRWSSSAFQVQKNALCSLQSVYKTVADLC